MPRIMLLLNGLHVTVFKNYIDISFHFVVIHTVFLLSSSQDSMASWLWQALLTYSHLIFGQKKSEKCFEVQLTGTFLLLGKNRQQSLKRLLKYPGSLLDNKREECVFTAVFPCSHTTLGFPQIKAGQPEDRK